jgi:methylmalonyl-CoA mutase cobalamin-binding subunit
VVATGDTRVDDSHARALVKSLGQFGVEATYLGREDCPERIAAAVGEQGADAVELCLGQAGGVLLLRSLLRELGDRGRRNVSIVVHRVAR